MDGTVVNAEATKTVEGLNRADLLQRAGLYPAPPGVPAERVNALRRSFDAMMKDAEFLEDAKRARFESEYGLPAYDALVLTADKRLANYFETVAKATKAQPKIAANWVMGELTGALNRENLEIDGSKVSAEALATLAFESKGMLKVSG